MILKLVQNPSDLQIEMKISLKPANVKIFVLCTQCVATKKISKKRKRKFCLTLFLILITLFNQIIRVRKHCNVFTKVYIAREKLEFVCFSVE